MSDTTTDAPRVCEHCGKPLVRKHVTVCGKPYPIGYAPCGCEEAAAARLAEKEAERERERMERRAAELCALRASGIPERYLNAADGRAAGLAEAWCEGIGFYIDGNQGTGKTHLAAATARELHGMGLSVCFAVVPSLMEAMRSRKAEDREQTGRLASADVLVLDDLGKETPTAYACERLFDIINERYNAELPVGVTSNYTRGEVAQRLTEGDVGKSIASRLCGMTRRVHLDGEDRRLRNG